MQEWRLVREKNMLCHILPLVSFRCCQCLYKVFNLTPTIFVHSAMLEEMQCVHKDTSFTTGSLEAFREAASCLLVWCRNVTNEKAFMAFAEKIMQTKILEPSERIAYANKERMSSITK